MDTLSTLGLVLVAQWDVQIVRVHQLALHVPMDTILTLISAVFVLRSVATALHLSSAIVVVMGTIIPQMTA